MYSVYIHICPNGKRYVGMTGQKMVSDRWRSGHGYKHCPDFHAAIIYYGWRNIAHEVVATGLDKGEAEALERELIAQYDTTNPEHGYNSYTGGLKGAKGNYVTRGRMSAAQSGSGNPMYGRHHSDKTKELIGATKRGKPLTAECKRKLGEVLGGEKNPAARAVCQFDKDMNFINRYPYIRAAMDATGANHVSACCRGVLKTSGGYIWRYADEAEETAV